MELNLSIDGAAINKYMAEKVLDSTLGDHIKKAIGDKIGEWANSYSSPLKAIIDQHVRQIVEEQLRTTYAPEITEAVKKAIDAEAVAKLTQEFVSSLKFKNDRY